jgi:hypothetical protein
MHIKKEQKTTLKKTTTDLSPEAKVKKTKVEAAVAESPKPKENLFLE